MPTVHHRTAPVDGLEVFSREAGQVPVLAVWGENDEIFSAAGAEAFRRDVPGARVELIDGGHFLFESHLDDAVRIIRERRAAIAVA